MYGHQHSRLTRDLYLENKCNFSGIDIDKMMTNSASIPIFSQSDHGLSISAKNRGRAYQERRGLACQLREAVDH